MAGIKAKKRLGQHFLADRKVGRRIVNSINPRPGDAVVEIGPGKGALTDILIDKGCQVMAIEFDRELAAYLRSKYAGKNNLKIIEKDFLKLSSAELPAMAKYIGNIPYNISTALLEYLADMQNRVLVAVFTVQAEVADRLGAIPNTRAYGSFTLITRACFDIEPLFDLGPGAFRPTPGVNSTVIRLAPADRKPAEFESFKTFIRGCFKQKRKTLVNSMELGLHLPKQNGESMLKQIGREIDRRPEQLAFEEYLNLYEIWRESIS